MTDAEGEVVESRRVVGNHELKTIPKRPTGGGR